MPRNNVEQELQGASSLEQPLLHDEFCSQEDIEVTAHSLPVGPYLKKGK